MQFATYHYRDQVGWSAPFDRELDSPQTLVLLFAAPQFVDLPAPLQEAAAVFARSHLAGCSTAGEIFGITVADRSAAVAVLRFEQSRVASTFAPVSGPGESYAAAQRLARRLYGPDLRCVLVFSDGLHVNGSELVRGFNSVLPPEVVVAGGLAGDSDRFEHTWIVHEGAAQSGLASAVGLYGGRLHIGHGSRAGWDIFGPQRLVTRSRHNVLYELDGKPALQLYKEYLGERGADLPASALLFPLALRWDSEDEKSIIRTVLGIDEENQSMIFAGDIQQGCHAQLMKANFDRLVDGAMSAGKQARASGVAAGPLLSIAISCVGRRLVLGERTEEELEATFDELPPHTEQIGFYSYSEISLYAGGHCDLHNQTMTLTTIAEA